MLFRLADEFQDKEVDIDAVAFILGDIIGICTNLMFDIVITSEDYLKLSETDEKRIWVDDIG